MTVSTIQQNDGTITLGGAGWATVTDTWSSGGSHANTATNGNTATIAVPSGKTGMLLLAPKTYNGGKPTITVDGTVVQTWDQTNGTSSSTAAYRMPRSCSYPIILNPATTHTVVLTAAAGGAALDAIEYYVAEAITPAKLFAAGHSFISGYDPTGGFPAGFPYRFDVRVGIWLGFGVYESVVAQTTTWNNDPTTTPAWLTAETGTNWHLQLPEVAVRMLGVHEYNAELGTEGPGQPTTDYYLQLFLTRQRDASYRMRCNCPGARIYNVGLTPWNGNVPRLLQWNSAYAALHQEAQMAANSVFVDVWNTFGNNGYNPPYAPCQMSADGLHPTDFGHMALAQTIYQAIIADRARGKAAQLGRV